MECPVCMLSMDNLELFGVHVDQCRFCGGVWFDSGELSSYIEKGTIPGKILQAYSLDDTKKVVAEGERKCPGCGKILKVINHKGINVDFCDNCKGIWFDKGELLQIIKNQAFGKTAPAQVKSQPVELSDDDIIRVDCDTLSQEVITKETKVSGEQPDIVESEVFNNASPDRIWKAVPKTIKDKIEKPALSYGASMPPELYLDKEDRKHLKRINSAAGMLSGGVGIDGIETASGLLSFVVSVMSEIL